MPTDPPGVRSCGPNAAATTTSSTTTILLCSNTDCDVTECCDCQDDENCTGKFMFIGAATVEANFCGEGRCTAYPANDYFSSAASWHLVSSALALAGASAPAMTYELAASSVKESGQATSFAGMKAIEEATSSSIGFVLSTSVHSESKQCIQELAQTFRDCSPSFLDAVGDALGSISGSLVSGGLAATAVASSMGVFAKLPGPGGSDVCTLREVSEKTMDCIVHGKTQTRTTEEQQEHALAHHITVTEMTKVTEKVATGKTMTCSVTVPKGVSLYQLRLVTPASREQETASTWLCVFCISKGNMPTDPPGVRSCESLHHFVVVDLSTVARTPVISLFVAVTSFVISF